MALNSPSENPYSVYDTVIFIVCTYCQTPKIPGDIKFGSCLSEAKSTFSSSTYSLPPKITCYVSNASHKKSPCPWFVLWASPANQQPRKHFSLSLSLSLFTMKKRAFFFLLPLSNENQQHPLVCLAEEEKESGERKNVSSLSAVLLRSLSLSFFNEREREKDEATGSRSSECKACLNGPGAEEEPSTHAKRRRFFLHFSLARSCGCVCGWMRAREGRRTRSIFFISPKEEKNLSRLVF